MKSVLVLGGSGFIGTNLCNALVAAGHHVVSAGRRRVPVGHASSAIHYADGSLNVDTDFGALVEGHDVIVHLTSGSTPVTSNLDMRSDVTENLLPTIALLNACRAAQTPRLIFLSSGGTVYGPDVEVPTSETAPTDPISSYGIVKLAAEKYLQMFERQGGPRSIVLRVANPFGPHQYAKKGQGAIAFFARQMLAGAPITIFGDGSVSRDFIYVDDVVAAIVASMVYDGDQRLFNVGSGTGKTVLEVVSQLATTIGVEPQLEFKPPRAFDVPTSILSIERAKEHLGWRPEVSWSDGIGRTVSWLSQHD